MRQPRSPVRSPLLRTEIRSSSKRELHGYFDKQVDGHTLTGCWRKPPVADRIHRALVQACVETPFHAHIADCSIPSDDNFENNFSCDARSTRGIGVGRLHFLQQPGRRDPRTRTVRSTAGAPSRALPDSTAVTAAHSGAATGTGTFGGSRSLAVDPD